MRADEPLPEDVTVTSAAYDRTTHLLTVGGSVHANNKPRGGINVHVFAGQSSDVNDMNEVGVAVTDAERRLHVHEEDPDPARVRRRVRPPLRLHEVPVQVERARRLRERVDRRRPLAVGEGQDADQRP